ncbi:MAG: hypothetical protein MPJ24_11985 [Pirellulaceae bacterium]|nr:hypothetical protein [Pirellulaceae bacterium]
MDKPTERMWRTPEKPPEDVKSPLGDSTPHQEQAPQTDDALEYELEPENLELPKVSSLSSGTTRGASDLIDPLPTDLGEGQPPQKEGGPRKELVQVSLAKETWHYLKWCLVFGGQALTLLIGWFKGSYIITVPLFFLFLGLFIYFSLKLAKHKGWLPEEK